MCLAHWLLRQRQRIQQNRLILWPKHWSGTVWLKQVRKQKKQFFKCFITCFFLMFKVPFIVQSTQAVERRMSESTKVIQRQGDVKVLPKQECEGNSLLWMFKRVTPGDIKAGTTMSLQRARAKNRVERGGNTCGRSWDTATRSQGVPFFEREKLFKYFRHKHLTRLTQFQNVNSPFYLRIKVLLFFPEFSSFWVRTCADAWEWTLSSQGNRWRSPS